MQRLFLTLAIACVSLLASANVAFKVDEKRNVVFTATIESLPLTADEIYRSALTYLNEAYKDTSYEIVEDSPEKGAVVGQGKMLGFHQQNGIIKSTTYSMRFLLRVDAKDGRARIQFIIRNYQIKTLSDIGTDGDEEFLVCECNPIGQVYNEKGHQKAFDFVNTFANKTLGLMESAIRNTTPSSSAADDDW